MATPKLAPLTSTRMTFGEFSITLTFNKSAQKNKANALISILLNEYLKITLGAADMDFWNVYEGERVKPEFGADRLVVSSRDRIHLSLSTVENYASPLDMDRGVFRKFSEAKRYVLATEMTHDLFVSIFNVNTTESILMRFSEPLKMDHVKRLSLETSRLKKPNLEMRIIGLQDKETELLDSVEMLHKAFKSGLIEADLFGNETRHIIFDLKLGMSFNLLLLNRIYKPKELLNTASVEEFAKEKSEFRFL